MEQTQTSQPTEAPQMSQPGSPATYGIGKTLNIGYYIVEAGIRLPMVFSTSEAACAHVALLKCSPLPETEIRELVSRHARCQQAGN